MHNFILGLYNFDETEASQNHFIKNYDYEPYNNYAEASLAALCVKHHVTRTCFRDLVTILRNQEFVAAQITNVDNVLYLLNT
jgi:hypothetical protein